MPEASILTTRPPKLSLINRSFYCYAESALVFNMLDVKCQVSNVKDSELRCIIRGIRFTERDDEDTKCVGVTRCGRLLQAVGL